MKIIIASLLLGFATGLDVSGGAYFITSMNYPAYTWGLTGDKAFIDTSGQYFKLVSPGLTGEEGTVSFELASQPGYFLRHYGYLLYLEQEENPRNANIFDVDATFRVRVDKFLDGYVAFESVNYPGHFIRHQNYRLKISREESSQLFKKDASWLLIEDASWLLKQATIQYPGPYFLRSKNYPDRSWGLNGNEAYIKLNGEEFNMISPGLTDEEGTVSFEAVSQPGNFLRHFGYFLYSESEDNPRNPHIFDVDATFRSRMDKFQEGYVAFESVNYPNHFIRHQNYRLKISTAQNTQLFKDDASWLLPKGAINYPGDVRLVDGPSDNEGIAQIFLDGQWGYICDKRKAKTSGWPSVFCNDLNGPESSAETALLARKVPGATVDRSVPVILEMPSCSPESANSMLNCGKNEKKDTCKGPYRKLFWVKCSPGSP